MRFIMEKNSKVQPLWVRIQNLNPFGQELNKLGNVFWFFSHSQQLWILNKKLLEKMKIDVRKKWKLGFSIVGGNSFGPNFLWEEIWLIWLYIHLCSQHPQPDFPNFANMQWQIGIRFAETANFHQNLFSMCSFICALKAQSLPTLLTVGLTLLLWTYFGKYLKKTIGPFTGQGNNPITLICDLLAHWNIKSMFQ